MRIKSVSQLSNANAAIPAISAIDWYIGKDCYIEMSLSSGAVGDEVLLYDSYKLDFGEYNNLISNEIVKIYNYINAKVKALSDYINELSDLLNRRLTLQDNVISNFISSMNDEFVHKVTQYSYVLNGLIISCDFSTESIEGTKVFLDDVTISGSNSLLCATQVIEGTARKALWG